MQATRLKLPGAVVLLGLFGSASGAVTLPKEGSFDTNFAFREPVRSSR